MSALKSLDEIEALEGRDNYEKVAKWAIDDLFSMYSHEMGIPYCDVPEVEGARYMLACLVNPKNRFLLDLLVEQSDMGREKR